MGRTKRAAAPLLRVLAILGLAAGFGGCGQVSFFDVGVKVDVVGSGITTADLKSIDSCEVTVSGATSDGPFNLDNCEAMQVTQSMIGTFQYGTDADSGSVKFHVEIFKNGIKAGQGDSSGNIVKGGRQTVTVTVMADKTVFAN